ncbi:MAG: hypothetical protein V2A72_06430 [Candidatus Omnitrophota bacterium]
MRKITAITIAIILAVPPNAFCLRPMANKTQLEMELEKTMTWQEFYAKYNFEKIPYEKRDQISPAKLNDYIETLAKKPRGAEDIIDVNTFNEKVYILKEITNTKLDTPEKLSKLLKSIILILKDDKQEIFHDYALGIIRVLADQRPVEVAYILMPLLEIQKLAKKEEVEYILIECIELLKYADNVMQGKASDVGKSIPSDMITNLFPSVFKNIPADMTKKILPDIINELPPAEIKKIAISSINKLPPDSVKEILLAAIEKMPAGRFKKWIRGTSISKMLLESDSGLDIRSLPNEPIEISKTELGKKILQLVKKTPSIFIKRFLPVLIKQANENKLKAVLPVAISKVKDEEIKNILSGIMKDITDDIINKIENKKKRRILGHIIVNIARAIRKSEEGKKPVIFDSFLIKEGPVDELREHMPTVDIHITLNGLKLDGVAGVVSVERYSTLKEAFKYLGVPIIDDEYQWVKIDGKKVEIKYLGETIVDDSIFVEIGKLKKLESRRDYFNEFLTLLSKNELIYRETITGKKPAGKKPAGKKLAGKELEGFKILTRQLRRTEAYELIHRLMWKGNQFTFKERGSDKKCRVNIINAILEKLPDIKDKFGAKKAKIFLQDFIIPASKEKGNLDLLYRIMRLPFSLEFNEKYINEILSLLKSESYNDLTIYKVWNIVKPLEYARIEGAKNNDENAPSLRRLRKLFKKFEESAEQSIASSALRPPAAATVGEQDVQRFLEKGATVHFKADGLTMPVLIRSLIEIYKKWSNWMDMKIILNSGISFDIDDDDYSYSAICDAMLSLHDMKKFKHELKILLNETGRLNFAKDIKSMKQFQTDLRNAFRIYMKSYALEIKGISDISKESEPEGIEVIANFTAEDWESLYSLMTAKLTDTIRGWEDRMISVEITVSEKSYTIKCPAGVIRATRDMEVDGLKEIKNIKVEMKILLESQKGSERAKDVKEIEQTLRQMFMLKIGKVTVIDITQNPADITPHIPEWGRYLTVAVDAAA